MRHQAGDIPAVIANAGDVQHRTIRIGRFGQFPSGGAILPENLVPGLQRGQGGFIGEIAAFAVGNRNLQDLARWNPAGKGGFQVRGLQKDLFAMELQVTVANQGAGQEAGFAQNLESVADANDQTAVGGKLLDGLHHRAEPGDGPAAQVVAIAEPAGHDHGIDRSQRSVFVPDEMGGVTQNAHGMDAILVAIGGRKLENGKVHEIKSRFRGGNPQSPDC